MSSRADYLQKYLAPKESDDGSKKKRRKVASKKSLVIHDDDANWNKVVDEEDEESRPQIIDPFAMKDAQSDEDEDEEVAFRRAFQPISGDSNQAKAITFSTEPTSDEPAASSAQFQNKKRSDSGTQRKRHDSPDLDVPRKRHDSPDLDVRRKRHDSPDLDVPRKRHDSPDLDVPRKRHDSPDLDVPRKRHDSPDLDVPRKRHDSPDLDVPRKRHDSPDLDVPRKRASSPSAENNSRRSHGRGSPSPRTEGGHRRPGTAEVIAPGVGLVQGADIKQIYLAKAAQEKAMLESLSAEELGVGSETVHRDASGRKLEPKLEKLRKRQEEQAKLEKQEKQMEWGRGVNQAKMKEQKMRDDLHEMEKPVARHVDDEDLNKLQREQLLVEDPMFMYILKKKDEDDAKSGKPIKPKYKGPLPPPNRFGIAPGFRWDGVNRSNGFEAKRYNRESQSKAWKEMEYKWRSEDL